MRVGVGTRCHDSCDGEAIGDGDFHCRYLSDMNGVVHSGRGGVSRHFKPP